MKKTLFIAGNFLSRSGGVQGPSEALAARFESNGWKVTCAGTHPVRTLRVLEILIKALTLGMSANVCLIEVYSGRAFLWAAVLGRLLSGKDRKIILALHGGGLVEFDRKHSRCVDSLFIRAQKIVTPSLYLKTHFIKKYPHIQYVPNALDLSKYPFRRRKKAKARICWLRAFHRIYQPQMAVEVIRFLSKDFPDVRLVMAGPDKGDGSYQEVVRLIKEYGLEKNIELKGRVEHAEVSAFLSDADIFLNTTSLESFGLSMMEAAASGLCLVSTRAGEIPLLWNEGEDCLMSETSDVQTMAENIRRILREPDLSGKISDNAREKTLAYDISRIWPKWEDLVTS